MKKTSLASLLDRNIKIKQIKILKRRREDARDPTYLELNLQKGSIWSIPDKSVPFDSKRKIDDLKDSNRPCLILETPKQFNDYATVAVAPGTSKYHKQNVNMPILLAKVPPEELKKSTYFLLYFRWYAMQKTLQKKICELSTNAKDKLSILLKELSNEIQ